MTLILKKGPAGYSGTIGDSLELIAKDTPISDVKLDGVVLTFAFPLADGGVRVTVKMEIKGDRATGGWATSEMEMGTFVFKKERK